MQRRILIATACGAVAALALMLKPAPVADPAGGPEASGYRVYIDPASGALTPQPAGDDPIPVGKDIERSLSTSAEGLREQPSPVPGGGTMVDLQGRFRNVSIATVDEDGNVEAPCASGLPTDDPADGNDEEGRHE